MYHLRFNGSHFEAGQKRGRIFKRFGIHFPIKLDDFQKEYGIQSGKILKQFFPEGYQEVLGVTDILQINHSYFLAWMMCMGCCMYNLENNIPEVRGCTAFAFTHNQNTYYGRNNDLPPFLKKGSKAEVYKLDNTSKFLLTTSSFINGEEGVNEYGLVVAMTFVMTNLLKIKPGFNSFFVVRYLLEKAKSTRDAIELMNKLPIASNMNILLADKTGDLVVLECSSSRIHIREALINCHGEKYIATTNEFTSKVMKPYEYQSETFQAQRRYEETINLLSKISPLDNPIVAVQSILQGKECFICQYDKKDNFQTIWSTIVHLNDLSIFRAEGDPRKAKFRNDHRLQDISKT